MPEREYDVDARSRDFRRYEQIDKRQDYRLAEAEGEEEFDEEFAIRTVSLAQAPDEVARALGAALEEIGFCILTDHGVDPALWDEAERRVFALFGGLTADDRRRFRAARHGSVNQGYFPIQETTDIHPDLVEGWVFCRRAFDLGERPGYDAAEFWPDKESERFFRRLCLEHETLVLPIMQAILRHLGQDPHAFDRKLTDTNLALRLNHYPPVPADAPAGAARLLGHEDVTLFTLLPAPTVEGLQVLNRENFRWIRLDAPRGSMILNTGDYMQRITNDRLPSTTHRVSRPRDPAQRALPRASFPLNVYLWEDEVLEVLPGLGEPKYAPIRAEEFHVRITSKYYGDDYA